MKTQINTRTSHPLMLAVALYVLSGLVAVLRPSPVLATVAPTVSGGNSFVYEGQLLNANGTPATGPVDLTFGIYSSNGSCLLYEETQSAVALDATDGTFTVSIGSAVGAAKRTANDRALPMTGVFSNSATFGTTANCGATYTPAAGDLRKLKVTVVQGGVTTVMSPMMSLGSVPSAMVADSLQGKAPTDLIQVSTDTTQSKVDTLLASASYAELLALVGGTSSQYARSGGTNFTPTADVSFNSKRITSVMDPASAQDAATKNYSDTKVVGKNLDPSLGTLVSASAGNGKVLAWDQTNNRWTASAVGAGTVTSVMSSTPALTVANGTTAPSLTLAVGTATNTVAAGDDSRIVNALSKTGSVAMTGNLNMATSFKIINLATPSANTDAANKLYADTSIGGYASNIVSPTTNQVIAWNGSAWNAMTPPSGAATGANSDITSTSNLTSITSSTNPITINSGTYPLNMTTTGTMVLTANTMVKVNGPSLTGPQNANLSFHNGTFDIAIGQTSPITVKGSNGNVGIGTTTPASTLDVAGNTNISGMITVSGPSTFSNPSLTLNQAITSYFAANSGAGGVSYAVTTYPGYNTLNPGTAVSFRTDVANAANPTLNVNSTSPYSLYMPDGITQLQVGAMTANTEYTAVYRAGAPNKWVVMNLPPPSSNPAPLSGVSATIPAYSATTSGLILLNGAAMGDFVMCSPDLDPGTNVTWSAFVSAANNVKVRLSCPSGTACTYATSAQWKCRLMK